MCKLVSPTDRQFHRLNMSEPTITITVPQDAELSQAIDEIIGLPNDGASTGEKVQKVVAIKFAVGAKLE